jgi:hypothetical protein
MAAAAVGLVVLANPQRGQAIEVFNTDFEGGLPPEFSAPGCLIQPVQGYAGLGETGNEFAGSFLRYVDLGILDTKLTLTGLPPHDHVTISFLLAVIDSWDGTELFKVSVDGVELFSHWFQIATGDASSYLAPPGGLLSSGTNIGFTGGTGYHDRDRAYDMSVEPLFISIPHTADTLTVLWHLGAVSGGAAQNWQGGSDESWALENVRVEVVSDPTGVGGTPEPRTLTMLPNWPNPFADATTFDVWLPQATDAQVEVFDVAGRRVRSDTMALIGGWQSVAFRGQDRHGRPLPSGVYFYRMRAAQDTRTLKIIVAR